MTLPTSTVKFDPTLLGDPAPRTAEELETQIRNVASNLGSLYKWVEEMQAELRTFKETGK